MGHEMIDMKFNYLLAVKNSFLIIKEYDRYPWFFFVYNQYLFVIPLGSSFFNNSPLLIIQIL